MIAVLAIALSGCGDTRQSPVATAVPTAQYSGAAEIERQIGGTFRARLYRLAVMTQAGDDSSDLGQQLPTGKLSNTSCSASGKKAESGDWNWRCEVQWRPVAGGSEITHYKVQVTEAGCVYALASPPLKQLHDATTNAPAESPLNSIVVPKKGC